MLRRIQASPAYAPDNKYVQLWLDFDNIAESNDEPDEPKLIGDANDIMCSF